MDTRSRPNRQRVVPRRSKRVALYVAITLLAIGIVAKLAHRESSHVVVFDGYGTPGRVIVSGRVLEDASARAPEAARAWWENLVDTWDLLASEEVPNVRLRIEIGRERFQTATDEEGLFELAASPLATPLPPGASQVRATVVGPAAWAGPSAVGVVHVLPTGSCVAVISDFDDTVAESHVTDRLRLVREAAFKNAAQIEPVPGVAEAYQRASRAGAVAFFYVSGSPINFFPRIGAFLDQHAVPRGPLLLKDFGRDPIFEQEGYKLNRIESLLETFPNMRVVLVGDSGERDPEIYRTVLKRHPARVAGIVVRRVPGDVSDESRFEGMATVEDYAGDPEVIARQVRTGGDGKPPDSVQ
jgi:phosphatidate phosphatase APP1